MGETFGLLSGAGVIAVAVAAFVRSRGWGIALPLLFIGAVVGALPIGPSSPPDPEIILLAVLAPLVFGEAYSASYLDLRRVGKPVLALAIGLVIATVFTVGGVVSLVAGVPIALACALGAILAPTDAVAVSQVAKRASLPRRLVSILEGESLVNDASGLTALRAATTAVVVGGITMLQVTGLFALSIVVGAAVGAACGFLLAWVLNKSRDLVAANSLVLIAPFPIYLVAEHFEGSGILAVVVAALLIGHRQVSDPGHTGRVQSTTVWKHLTFILQSIAFFMVGLEIPAAVARLTRDEQIRALYLIPIVVAVLIVTRAIFVLFMVTFSPTRRSGRGRQLLAGAFVITWAGARGPISGLAAFSLPFTMSDGSPFPDRDLVLGVTFGVIVLTLLVAPTLGPLSRWLGVEQDDDSGLVKRVQAELARAALERLAFAEEEAADRGQPLPRDMVDSLRKQAEARLSYAESTTTSDTQELRMNEYQALVMSMIRAEQEELLQMRDEEGLPDAIIKPLQHELDIRATAARRPARRENGPKIG